ncbi:MAG: amino acid adenylation domain-containing protein, partial [Candidatus Electrothrix sp. EH2]|nr:amino acid adenylation domain-containing protein [Candidatus Electrothrix sp. EH2]
MLDTQLDDLAYVIYTSGSTGRPKGTAIYHRGIVNLLNWYCNALDLAATDKTLLVSALSFDLTQKNLFAPLIVGASICMPDIAQYEPDRLLELIAHERITWVNCAPSAFYPLVELSQPANWQPLASLRWVVLGGEPIQLKLLKEWLQACQDYTNLMNSYGPTECSDVSTAYVLPNTETETAWIGQAIPNVRIYILSSQLQPQPPGIPGELCIAGRGVGRGYLNRAELTAEKFIEVELFGKVERIYKTGDLARWLPDGNLEYLGRIDYQVKLRGLRIETEEIEAEITQHEVIKEAVVILCETNDIKRLVAYLTVAANSSGLITELKERLKERLPDYMIPSYFVVLQNMPLTPNGKIDRKALPVPEINLSEDYEGPRNEIEQELVLIWSNLLTSDNISIHDNFFELGGDSILSIQIVSKARQAGLQLTPRDLFQHQTIAELATAVRFGVEIEAEQGLVTGSAPLTPIQDWFFEQNYPEYWHYNQSILLQVPIDLNLDALRQALAAMLSHHDVLRLRYTKIAGNHWHQSFSEPTETLPLIIEDLSTSKDFVADLYQLTEQYQASLNITEGPLTYLVFIKRHDSARLFWCIHHLVIDGISWRILLEDLQTAYKQVVAGQRLKLPPKTSSFKAWAERLANYALSTEVATESAYWQTLPALSLPVDKKDGKNRLEHQQNYIITFTHQETDALLNKVPAAYNTRINDVLLTALALAFTEWTGTDRILIDLEGHGRTALFDEIDLSRTVGWFTSIHPVTLTVPAGSRDSGSTLKVIKEQLRNIPQEGIGYGLLAQLVGKALPKGDLLFNYLGQFDQTLENDDFTFATEATANDISLKGIRDHLIEINGAVTQGELWLNWSYSSYCYTTNTIHLLAESYKRYLYDLIVHCQNGKLGVTPSDFPLADVPQATLDDLYATYSELSDIYPLSPMQQGMLFHALYEPKTGVYFEQMQLRLSNLDPRAFRKAWQHQVKRHANLRTAFLVDQPPFLQIVQTVVQLPWREQDWREFSQEEQQSQLEALLEYERYEDFDLSTAPLMRFDLIRLDAQQYVFICHFHHILMDGWCLPIMLNEIREDYLAFKSEKLSKLQSERPYRNYIDWLIKQDSTAAQQYWQQRLAGFITPTQLPIVAHQTEPPKYSDTTYTLSLETTQQLQSFTQKHRLTLNTLVQGAWALLLNRYSSESDICFGVTVSGRHAPLTGIEQMMGLFINTLPLRIEVNPDNSVKEYLLQIQTYHQNDNRYAHIPLFEAQKMSEVPSSTPLFDSLLVFENYPLGRALEKTTESFQIEDFQFTEYTNYPLTLTIAPGELFTIKVSYDRHRTELDAIKRMLGHFQSLLAAMADNPDLAVKYLPMLNLSEIRQLQAWNDTAAEYPADKTLADLFEEQTEKTPDNVAVFFEGEELTYRELNEKANRLASHLLMLKKQAAMPDNPLIAIAVERSLDMIIGLLGILKAGCAYVPIDPDYPPERIRYMMEHSAAPLLLTQTHLRSRLPSDKSEYARLTVCLDEADFADQSAENLVVRPRQNDLAYVIYTSGSTGKPKGVMIEHRNLSNFLHDMRERTGITAGDRLLAVTTLSFDIAALELYLPLISGSVLHLADRTTVTDGRALRQHIVQHAVNFMQATPATWQLLRHGGWQTETPLNILCGGEAFPAELVNYLLTNSRQLWNVYGPTETTIWSTARLLATPLNNAAPSIGVPLANTRIYILDVQDQLQPVGVPGELCIAGAGLARGYLNRPELTAEKFVKVELFGKTERIYRTGDLAR